MKNEIAAKEKLIEKEIVYNVFKKKWEMWWFSNEP